MSLLPELIDFPPLSTTMPFSPRDLDEKGELVSDALVF